MPTKNFYVKMRNGHIAILTQTISLKTPTSLICYYSDDAFRIDPLLDGPFYNSDHIISQHDLIDPSEYEPYFNEIQEILRKKNKVKLDMTVAELSRILSTYEGDAITEDDLVQHFGRNGFQFKG